MRPSSSCTGMWTVISRAALLRTLHMPSSRRRRAAAWSKRIAAEGQGLVSSSSSGVVASIYTSGSIMLQAIARKPGSFPDFGERFVGGKGVTDFSAGKFPGFGGASSNLSASGQSQKLFLYKHHGIWGGEKQVVEVLVRSLKL